MNIQTCHTHAKSPLATQRATTFAPNQAEEASNPGDSFQSSDSGSLKGVVSRAVYGAALYGLPAIAGATMGINGVLPGALVGGGLGAVTHLDTAKQAAIFGATGAVTGAAGAYIGFLGATIGMKLPAVLVAAAVGAGSQALFALTQQQQQ